MPNHLFVTYTTEILNVLRKEFPQYNFNVWEDEKEDRSNDQYGNEIEADFIVVDFTFNDTDEYEFLKYRKLVKRAGQLAYGYDWMYGDH